MADQAATASYCFSLEALCVSTSKPLSTTQKRKAAGLCPQCCALWTGPTHYCPPCTVWQRLRARERHRQRKGQCTRCLARPPVDGRTYCLPCIGGSRKAVARLRTRYRDTVLTAYGGKCACCSNPNRRVLQLDHVNNDGAGHRKVVKQPMYKWAYLNGCPDTLQLLCANCHHVKTVYGRCLPSDHDHVNAPEGSLRSAGDASAPPR